MCPVCNENHDIEDCTYCLQQAVEERSKFQFKNKLCYGCLKTMTKEHNAKTCQMCNGKHVTALGGYLRKKAAINSERCEMCFSQYWYIQMQLVCVQSQ